MVFDIDGDRRIPTVSVDSEQAVLFDIDADGVVERVGWLADPAGDAFLWIDLNGNGALDDGSEMFGSSTELPGGGTASHGFVALAVYDRPSSGGNGDGTLTESDEVWGSLRLWFDLNSNGAFEAGESSSLDDRDIDAISLQYAQNIQVDAAGNTHTRRGGYWGPSEHGRGRCVRRGLIEDIVLLAWDQ